VAVLRYCARIAGECAGWPRSPEEVVAGWHIPLTPDEREVLIDLIRTVRTVAGHALTLHLQLGAVRAVLARKGHVTEAEMNAALAELDALTIADQVVNPVAPNVDAVFVDLLTRLEQS
jgi:hypothetical protein